MLIVLWNLSEKYIWEVQAFFLGGGGPDFAILINENQFGFIQSDNTINQLISTYNKLHTRVGAGKWNSSCIFESHKSKFAIKYFFKKN